jgi:hypothetical protein
MDTRFLNAKAQRRKGAKALPILNRDSFFASLRLGDFALKNPFILKSVVNSFGCGWPLGVLACSKEFGLCHGGMDSATASQYSADHEIYETTSHRHYWR